MQVRSLRRVGTSAMRLVTSLRPQRRATRPGMHGFLGPNSVSKVNRSGALVATGSKANGCFIVDYTTTSTSETSTQTLIYDRINDQLWGVADLGVAILHPDGTQAFCDMNGANLPLTPFYSTITGKGNGTQGFLVIGSAAVDGGGNLWFATSGQSIVMNNYVSTFTFMTALNSVTPSGNLTTSFNFSGGVLGLQTQIGSVFGDIGSGEALAIDAYGSIWEITYNYATDTYQLVRTTGLAVPKNYQ